MTCHGCLVDAYGLPHFLFWVEFVPPVIFYLSILKTSLFKLFIICTLFMMWREKCVVKCLRT